MSEASKVAAVYRGLKRAIICQALSPGMRLPEDSVGETFGVSRTIARAAFAQLAAEGLVEMRLNKGATVASPTLEEARDVFAVRRGLERIVMETLAERLTEREAARLLAHVEAEENVDGRDGPDSIRLAGEFHTLLAEATGNPILVRYVGEVVSRCSLILALYGRPHSSDCAVAEHRQVVEALVAHDVPKAVGLMDAHLGAVVRRALLDPKPNREKDIRDILSSYIEDLNATPRPRPRRAR